MRIGNGFGTGVRAGIASIGTLRLAERDAELCPPGRIMSRLSASRSDGSSPPDSRPHVVRRFLQRFGSRPFPPVPSRARPRLALLLCLVSWLGAFAVPAGGAGTAWAADLVKNTLGTLDWGAGGSAAVQIAQKFTTGSNTEGYQLSEIEVWLDFSGTPKASPRMSIYTHNEASNHPDTSLYTMTAPTFSGAAYYTFTAPDNATLDPNETYYVVFESTNAGQFFVSEAADYTSTGADGWDIADGYHLNSNTTPVWLWIGASAPTLFMEIRGDIVSDATPPRVTSIKRSSPAAERIRVDPGFHVLKWEVVFSEDVRTVDPADFTLRGTTASMRVFALTDSVYQVIASDGNLADINDRVTLDIVRTPTIEDLAGNALVNTTPTGANETFTVDNTGPLVNSIERQDPSSSSTDADTLTWRVTFNEAVDNVDAADFAVDGTTAVVTVAVVTDSTTDHQYDVTASGGNLASVDGMVTLSFAPGQDIADDLGNPLVYTRSFGTDARSFRVDNAGPLFYAGTVNEEKLHLTYREPLNADSVPPASAFVVKVETITRNLATTDPVAINGPTVTLTLSSAVTAGRRVKVSYTVPTAAGTSKIQDRLDHAAAALPATTLVTNIRSSNATGRPRIVGGTPVGNALYAKLDGIGDPQQGIDTVSSGTRRGQLDCASGKGNCAFQWIRVDGTDETDIPAEATKRTYRTTEADIGKKVKVRLSFNDRSDNRETRTSDSFPGGDRRIVARTISVAIEDVEFSGPGADGMWTEGETVDVTLVLSEPVRLASTGASIPVHLQGDGSLCGPTTGQRSVGFLARYRAGNGTHRLTFRCEVHGEASTEVSVPRQVVLYLQGDRWTPGTGRVVFSLDPLRTGGTNRTYSRESARHGLAGPSIADVRIDAPTSDGVWNADETVQVRYVFSGPVEVGGRPDVVVRQANATGTGKALAVPFARIENGNTVVFARRLEDLSRYRNWLSTSTAFEVDANAIRLHKGFIAGVIAGAGTGGLANLSHRAYRGAAALVPPCGALAGEFWCETMTVGQHSTGLLSGYLPGSSVGSLSNTLVSYGTDRPISWLYYLHSDSDVYIAFSTDFLELDNAGFSLHLGPRSYAFPADVRQNPKSFVFNAADPGWSVGDRVVVRLTGPAATGGGGGGGGVRSEAPEATFENLPPDHDGTNGFTVGLRFSGAPAGLTADDAASVLEVTGGTVTGARSTSKEANAPWEVTVEPGGPGEVTVRVPARACDEAHAVCIDGRALARAVEATVPGTPMTASFTQAPRAHDGAAAFLLHLEFSHEPNGFSYRTVHGGLFDVAGGRIVKARRLEKGRNLRWEVTVEPDGGEAVTLAARATADCAAQHAACDANGRKFTGGLALTVPGPATLPAVSIAPASTPVSEGTAASFTLTRTGDTAAALTVTLAVTESGAMLDGAPPVSATFAAGSASAELSVATLDDEAAEAASTVTAALSADAAYTVDASAGAADIVVEDDDAAPVVGTASPIEVAENATDIAALTATDEDTAAAELAWSIPEGAAGGADAAQFALTAEGVLSFEAAKDFEAPDDADADGDYEVTVRVTDGANPVDAALVVRLQDVDDAAPVLTGASVDGATLTLVFGEALDGGSEPAAPAFTVTVAGEARAVDAVSTSGSTLTLTLSSAVSSGETVTVGYTVPTGEMRRRSGTRRATGWRRSPRRK